MPECPDDNTLTTDQTQFWDSNGMHWDAHRIGWAIAGGCSVVTVLISLVTVWQHCRNYTNRAQQRQILRILYMPPVYAIISFFSYRFFRSYTYYSLVEVAYEAVTLSAFLLLLIDFVADTAHNHDAENAIARKDKRPLPLPFCCWRYRPTKAYFMYTLKWSVLQYVIIRPAVSVVGIITQKLNVLCENAGFDWHFANAYLEVVDFISISVALYGLFLFYGLTKDELKGRQPLAKFLCIKLIVMFTWYQGFVFTALEGRVIKGSEFWTATNVANGLNALTICIEMIFFAIGMYFAYNAKEYARPPGMPPTSIWRPLWDSINYSDFGHEIFGSFHFFFDYFSGKPSAHGHGHRTGNPSFANNGQDTPGNVVVPAHSDVIAAQGGTGPGPVQGEGGAARASGYLAPGGGRNEWRRSHGRPKMDLAQAFRLSGSGYSNPPYDSHDDGSRPSYDSRTPITAASPSAQRVNYSRPMRGGGIAEETGAQGENGA